MNSSKARELTGAIREIRDCVAVWAVGSRVSQASRAFPCSASDLLVIFDRECDQADRLLDLVLNTLVDISGEFPARIFDDAVLVEIEGSTISIAAWPLRELRLKLDGYASGKSLDGSCRTWALGYWFPEALLCDVMRAVPYDATSRECLTELRSALLPYPPALLRELKTRAIDEIRWKGKWCGKGGFESALAWEGIRLAVLRAACAMEEFYPAGFHETRSWIPGFSNDRARRLAHLSLQDEPELPEIIALLSS